MAVRELKFSLLQLTLKVDELIGAIQCILGGRLPMTLVKPLVLYSVLRNVSLHLPENHELIAGTKWSNIYYYYDVIQATVVGNTHGMKILSIPVKSANQHFILYKLTVMPKRVSDERFFKYLV